MKSSSPGTSKTYRLGHSLNPFQDAAFQELVQRLGRLLRGLAYDRGRGRGGGGNRDICDRGDEGGRIGGGGEWSCHFGSVNLLDGVLVVTWRCRGCME